MVSSTFVSFVVGACLIAIALVVYTASHPYRLYDHFVWQASAFLEGQAAIRYLVAPTATTPGNDFFQDVLPVASTDGTRRLVPFPPLPAILLMPFVWLWGLNTDGQLIFAILGALDVGLAWWVVGKLPIRFGVRVAATIFFGFGTVFWYTAQIGTTWYQAHVLAVAWRWRHHVAIAGRSARSTRDGRTGLDGSRSDGRRRGRIGVAQPPASLAPSLASSPGSFSASPALPPDRGLRAPFFLLVGPGGSWQRRGWSAALGAGSRSRHWSSTTS